MPHLTELARFFERLVELVLDPALPDAQVVAFHDRIVRRHVSDVLLQGHMLLVDQELLEDGQVEDLFKQGLAGLALKSPVAIPPSDICHQV